jgi:predicted dehydrogenase
MKNAAVLGAGQLGSRHLQSLAQAKINMQIHIVEPSAQAAALAKQRLDEIKPSEYTKTFQFHTELKTLPENLELVIVATNADIRFSLIKDLVSLKKVKNMILEKVLFQRKNDFLAAAQIFEEQKINVWVNHPRRMYPFYHKVKASLNQSNAVTFQLSGGNWAIASNGLHFVDLFGFLTSSNNFEIVQNLLDQKLINSRRPGYYEASGTLIGKSGKHICELNCLENFAALVMSILEEFLSFKMSPAIFSDVTSAGTSPKLE